MKYSIHSDMMSDLTGKSPGLFRRVVAWLLLPLAYCGAFISPTVALAIPFKIFHEHHFSPALFWCTTLLIAALLSRVFYFVLIAWLRFFRQRLIYVDAAVLFAALVFAVAVVAWVYPPK
jgi:hypothetical protein